MKHSPLEKLPSSRLVKKLPAFYVTRRFNTAFTRARPPLPMLSRIISVPDPPTHFWRIHFNSILPSMPRSFEVVFCLRFPNQNPVCISHSSVRVTRPVQLILLLIIGQYLMRSTGRYAVSCIYQLSLPFYALIPSSALHSQLP